MILRVKGDLGVQLGSLQGRIKKGLNDAASESADQLVKMVKDNISRGFVDLPWGEKEWQPLSDKYAKSIGADTPASHPGLIITGALLSSVKSIQYGDGKFEVVVTDPKAELHEYGVGNNPKRPFFRPAYFAFRESGMANDILEEHISGAFDNEL